eukprot:Rhum_TRINITY_DN10601_c0_g1::Rhum_TRINITY_DN10601_c0_g1_i1::g.39215::m.39215
MPAVRGTTPLASAALCWFAGASAVCWQAEAAYVAPADPYAAVYKAAQAVWPITGSATQFTAVSNTFGPRRKNSEGGRYDWHRGIDLPCAAGAPVYAAAAGVVRIAGATSAYSDPLVQLKHEGTDAAGDPYVYYTNYLHADESLLTVSAGDTVAAGDQIGGCGKSVSGFYHVHFELREGGLFQQHCVHPLRLLPWHPQETWQPQWVLRETSVSDAPGGASGRYVVNTTVTLPLKMLHLQRVEVSLVGATLRHTTQSGRDVRPPFLDLHSTTFQYTHRSGDWPQADCPYADAHPAGSSYSANVHADTADFNGVVVAPGPFSSVSPNHYTLAVSLDVLTESDALEGTAAADRCFVITATAVKLPQQRAADAPASWTVWVGGAACGATTSVPTEAPCICCYEWQRCSGVSSLPFMPLAVAAALLATCL